MTRFAHPANEAEVSDVFRMASEKGQRLAVIGAGTHGQHMLDPDMANTGNLGHSTDTADGHHAVYTSRQADMADVTVCMTSLNQILEFSPSDLVVTVQPGVTLDALQTVLAAEGKMLPLDPWVPTQATIGGITAAGLSGPRRALYGTTRDMAIGLRVVYPDGTLVRTGGKVVKNVAGYDMTKLFIGSRGTLGAITELTFKLRPLPLHRETVVVHGSTEQVARLAKQLRASILIPARAEAISKDDPGLWELAIDCDENQTSASYQTRELGILANSLGMHHEVFEGHEADLWWERRREEGARAQIGLKLAMPPSNWEMFVSELADLRGRVRRASGDGGDEDKGYVLESFGVTTGVGRIFLRGVTPDVALDFFNALCVPLSKYGGTATVERGMEWPTKLPLSRGLCDRIKRQIDPQGILPSLSLAEVM